MPKNRVASFFNPSAPDPDSGPSQPGFIVNPLAASLAPWQIEIYQAAFRQAQRDLQDPRDDRPFVEYQI